MIYKQYKLGVFSHINNHTGSIMHSKVFSATTIGVDAHAVEVEIDLSYGMVNFFIVGLPDTAIRESSRRVTTALKNSGIRLPQKKITVNLAPAHIKKEGTLFDLPIAVGIIKAMKLIDIPDDFLNETLFLGELSLDGAIRPIKGALAIAFDAHKLNKKRIILPADNANEAALIKNLEVIGVKSIVDLIAFLRGEKQIAPTPCSFEHIRSAATCSKLDFADVKGQKQAKRALQIAAAGRHNVLFIGSPGSGKTMLAQRLPSIMPRMSFQEVLQTSKIYSVSGKLTNRSIISQRPFRAPHHTISQAGLVGGGSFPQPGEISLAHNGILFLDELTEFKKDTLEVLRQPLENKRVDIARVQQSVSFPASFLLIAALNPCPCGYLGDKKRTCTCSPQQINRYLGKLSGPLLDRIDLHVHVQSVDYETISTPTADDHKNSEQIYKEVISAAKRQYHRSNGTMAWNSSLASDSIEKICTVTPEAQALLQKTFDVLKLSMRGYHKTLKVARTIADLEGSDLIEATHIREAISYRSLDNHFERHRQ